MGSEIHRVLAHLLLHEVRDPQAAAATVTRVRVTPDLRLARVYFGLMIAEESDPEEVRKALGRVVPFLRRKLAAELELRFTPELAFFFDSELEDARRVDDLLRGLHRDEEGAAAARGDGADAGESEGGDPENLEPDPDPDSDPDPDDRSDGGTS